MELANPSNWQYVWNCWKHGNIIILRRYWFIFVIKVSLFIYNYVTYRCYLLYRVFIYLHHRSFIFHTCLNIFSCELQLGSFGNNWERCSISGNVKVLGKCFRKTFWDITFNGFQFPIRYTAPGFIRGQINSSNCRVFNILFLKLSVFFQ